MVEIRAFRAHRYNKEIVGDYSKVIAPPYDVIMRDYRDKLRDRSPYNCIWVTLGEEIEENREKNLYAEARKTLDKWISEGVIKQDEKPAIYVYEQAYTLAEGKELKRKGLIPLVKLTPFEDGIVLPHEFTLSGPKVDRLELLRATEFNTETIFALFKDDSSRINEILAEKMNSEPSFEATDDNNVISRLWVIDEENKVNEIVELMKGKKLFIADGHHRYETHVNYSKENPKADAMPILLVEMNDSGLIVLPTHRLMYGIEGFNFNDFIRELKDWFDTEKVSGSAKELEEKLAEKHEKAFIARSRGKTVLFTLKDSTDLIEMMPDLVDELRTLDVSILHRLVIERLLGVSAEQIARKEHIQYIKDFEQAIEKADSKEFDVGFLMNATKKQQVVDSCLAGQKMPQKSTYFYPKIVSGTLFRKIE